MRVAAIALLLALLGGCARHHVVERTGRLYEGRSALSRSDTDWKIVREPRAVRASGSRSGSESESGSEADGGTGAPGDRTDGAGAP